MAVNNQVSERSAVVCAATGIVVPQDCAVRFVVPRAANPQQAASTAPAKDLTWMPDLNGDLFKVSARHAWLSPDPIALKLAVERGIIGAAPASTAMGNLGGWRGVLDDMVTRRIADAISLARRAGGAVSGAVRVTSYLAAHAGDKSADCVLFSAVGASRHSLKKLLRYRRWLRPYDHLRADIFQSPPEGAPSHLDDSPANITSLHCNGVLSRGEIGIAFGKDSVVHAVVWLAGLLPRLVADCARLSALRRIAVAA